MVEKMVDVERRAVVGAIIEMGGDVALAAKALGLAQATVYRKLQKYGTSAKQIMKEARTIMSNETPKSRYDLTEDGDRREIDVGSADWDVLRAEIENAPVPLARAAEIADAAGVAAEHQAWLTEMAVKGLELLIKGAKKAIR